MFVIFEISNLPGKLYIIKTVWWVTLHCALFRLLKLMRNVNLEKILFQLLRLVDHNSLVNKNKGGIIKTWATMGVFLMGVRENNRSNFLLIRLFATGSVLTVLCVRVYWKQCANNENYFNSPVLIITKQPLNPFIQIDSKYLHKTLLKRNEFEWILVDVKC